MPYCNDEEPDFSNPRNIIIEVLKNNGYHVAPVDQSGWVLNVKRNDKNTIVLINHFGEEDTLDNLFARIMEEEEPWVKLSLHDPTCFDELLHRLSLVL